MNKYKPADYPVLLYALTADDGGGYLAVVVDLPGCMSDGETPAAAFTNAQDAALSWIEAAIEMGRPIPDPSSPQPELLKRTG